MTRGSDGSEGTDIFDELYEVVEDRRDNPKEESYTSSLMEDEDRILEKIGEEVTETVVAAKNTDGDSTDDLVHESADVIYHLFVLLAAKGVELDELAEELEKRRG